LEIKKTIVDAHLNFRLIELLFTISFHFSHLASSCVKRFSLLLLCCEKIWIGNASNAIFSVAHNRRKRTDRQLPYQAEESKKRSELLPHAYYFSLVHGYRSRREGILRFSSESGLEEAFEY